MPRNATQTTSKAKAGFVLAVLLLCACSKAVAVIHYVNLQNAAPSLPYTNWSAAATTIQDAVDAASAGDEVVVADGVYQTGGRSMINSNRVWIAQGLVVRSLNGPASTIIQGYQVPGTTNGDQAVRCVLLESGAQLIGFTLTNGATSTVGAGIFRQNGGGVSAASDAIVSNCFLLGNSTANTGGGAQGGILRNCVLRGNSAWGGGGGAGLSTLFNCTITENSAAAGGGSASCTVSNCTFLRNQASSGGGASSGTLISCTLSGNFASSGGGVSSAVLRNCTLTGNSASSGGAADSSFLDNCALTGNSAKYGGGTSGGGLNNCALFANSAAYAGGGALSGVLNNCTITGNSASFFGGGISACTLNNCIIYYNQAPVNPNCDGSALNYCCTTPLPASGSSNISSEPLLASFSHLSAASPCRGMGSDIYVNGVDIDGEPWGHPPSIGCDEVTGDVVTNYLTATIQGYTNVSTDFVSGFRAVIDGQAAVSWWEFGDGTVVSNHPYVSHSWAGVGDYDLVLRAVNNANLTISATLVVHVVARPVHYVVASNGAGASWPYESWATAATNIQDAVDAATVPGALVLVSNGVYQAGGRVVYGSITNRLAVTKAILVRSLNGPALTTIQGNQVPGSIYGDSAVRCVYLTNGAVLVGFTLTNGATRFAGDPDLELSGGGVWCDSASAVVSNCVLVGNSANSCGGGIYRGTVERSILTNNYAVQGGGACYATLNLCTLFNNNGGADGGAASLSTLRRCTLSGNSASSYGGGVNNATMESCLLVSNWSSYLGGGSYGGTLNNCSLIGNSAGDTGGGACSSTLNNCIVYYNTAPASPNYYGPALSFCCTIPMPPDSSSNFTNAPGLLDLVRGDFHVSSNSPCINAGRNTFVSGSCDLDGNSRIVGGTVDVGAYEFQTPASTISYAWLRKFGLPIDGSADFTDTDGDGFNNWQEWRAGTDPLDPASALKMLSCTSSDSGATISWTSVTNRSYALERAIDSPTSSGFTLLQRNIPGSLGFSTFNDTNVITSRAYYRVRVEQ